MIGEELDGRYRILSRLGTGGMGEVYLAEHLVLRRREAIKIVKSRLANDNDYLARFRREARATNRVQHPNIVSVYDFGRLADGRLYLTMEFANGPSLEKLLRADGPFDAARAIHVLRQLATAVGFAHERGVIHRDLKPDNLVLIEQDGDLDHVKILDFGVAKIIAPEYLESAAISREGELFGTPAYIAPEQIRGVRDDPRIDIYALGCIAFELVSGRTPFVGRPMDVLEAHMSEAPARPSERVPGLGLPPQLEDCILRCLAKEPGHRFQTGGELAEMLGRLAVTLTPPSYRRLRRESQPFSDDETEEGMPAALLDALSQSTTNVYPTRSTTEVRRLLCDIAERICDLGGTNPQILVTVAEIHQVERDRESTEAELEELSRRATSANQVAREREASLRFALGELRFGRNATNGGSVDRAVEALRQRLEVLGLQAQREMSDITERQITLTARRASQDEELTSLYLELDRILGEERPSHRTHPAIRELYGRLDQLQHRRVS